MHIFRTVDIYHKEGDTEKGRLALSVVSTV